MCFLCHIISIGAAYLCISSNDIFDAKVWRKPPKLTSIKTKYRGNVVLSSILNISSFNILGLLVTVNVCVCLRDILQVSLYKLK